MAAAALPDRQDRASYLAEVCELLWPRPARVTGRGHAAGRTASPGAASDAGLVRGELIVLPGLRQPRLLVPAGRRSAAAAVRRYGEPGSAKARLAARTLAAVLASGLGKYLLRDRLSVVAPDGTSTIETYLSNALGQPVQLSIHLGAARANRKPVLQLLTPGGATIGFAKIGVNRLTTDLVRAERGALDRLGSAGLTTLRAPRVLHHGSWHDLEVLVLSPLPVWARRRPLRAGQLAAAMTELAGVAGVQRRPLTASAYLDGLIGRLDPADEAGDTGAIRLALRQLASQAADTQIGFGAWHGDWTPWNMASTADGLLLWDWERFTVGVPVGFDALHYWLQTQVVSARRDPYQAAADCVERAPALLGPLAVPPPQARLTALAYLADLSVRYLADGQEQAGARLGAPGRWLIPALAAGVSSR